MDQKGYFAATVNWMKKEIIEDQEKKI